MEKNELIEKKKKARFILTDANTLGEFSKVGEYQISMKRIIGMENCKKYLDDLKLQDHIIEDDNVVLSQIRREIYIRILSELGIIVDTAKTTKEAIVHLSESQVGINLFIKGDMSSPENEEDYQRILKSLKDDIDLRLELRIVEII